jgi:ribonuclease-3
MSVLSRLKALFGAAGELPPPQINLDDFEQLIGYTFKDRSLLLLGLTHRSYSHSNGKLIESNERLEFLGDSVLGMVISDQLYRDYPDLREGQLTKTKALLVNENTLASIGEEIGLNKFIQLSHDEERSGGRARSSIVSDAVESVLGAIYLDGGLDPVREVILRVIYDRKDSILADKSLRNFKGELLELVQARGNSMPHYDVVSERGPDHRKMFSVIVSVGDRVLGKGSGSSKKEAEQRAAAAALKALSDH